MDKNTEDVLSAPPVLPEWLEIVAVFRRGLWERCDNSVKLGPSQNGIIHPGGEDIGSSWTTEPQDMIDVQGEISPRHSYEA